VALGCDMLMCAPGQIAAPISEAIVNLRTGADIVSEFSSLRLAIEFNSQHEVLNNVHALGELLAGAGKKNCGYLLDAYHLTRSGSPGRGFADVPGEEIFVFQYSDVPPQPVAAGVKRPTDRLPPGKGTVRWREMLGLLAEKGYTGYLSYEAPNPELWARSPYEVAKEGVELTRKLLQDAVPSYAA
jgi:sugar phosphate isomerase/epimerase